MTFRIAAHYPGNREPERAARFALSTLDFAMPVASPRHSTECPVLDLGVLDFRRNINFSSI
jgi:hypothetical protein